MKELRTLNYEKYQFGEQLRTLNWEKNPLGNQLRTLNYDKYQLGEELRTLNWKKNPLGGSLSKVGREVFLTFATENVKMFSIVIPLFNKEAYIQKTIETVLRQSFQDFEVIIVNDGSTDKSMDIVRQISDPRIRLFSQTNQGVSAARNLGMRQAQHPYIAFLDADDEWLPEHLHTLYEATQKFPNAGLFCSRYISQISPKVQVKPHFIGISEHYEGYVKDFFESSLVHRVALTSAVCIPKSIVAEVGYFDENISSGQDLDYWIRIALRHPVAITHRETMVYHYQAPKSLSKTSIGEKKLPNFDKFKAEEQHNASLKRFLDLYRTEYALHFHIIGDIQQRNRYLAPLHQGNLSKKVKILLALPPFILRILLQMKRRLKDWGVDFSIYH